MQRPRTGAGSWGRITSGLPFAHVNDNKTVPNMNLWGFGDGKCCSGLGLITDIKSVIQQMIVVHRMLANEEVSVGAHTTIGCITIGKIAYIWQLINLATLLCVFLYLLQT